MQVTILSTGNELVTGVTPDTNAPSVARVLSAHGFRILRMGILGDEPELVCNELEQAARISDIIVLTGGLGPTADDRNRRAVARAAGRKLVRDDDALSHMRCLLSQHGVELSRSHERQAFFPEGAVTFPNVRGTALGFACTVGDATLVAMPGVPDEMTVMFENEVLPFLLEEYQGRSVVRNVHLFGIPESEVDERIADMMQEGRNPSVGLTVAGGVVSVCLRAQAEDEPRGHELLDRDEEMIRGRFGEACFGTDQTTLAGSVSHLLEQQELRVAVAESCTGGAVGALLVDVPGISRFFLLDVVAYSNEAKMRQLGVPAEELEAVGAVSPQVAQSMARGACEACGAELGISTTGIAGPTGGTPQKPVGLVYVGVCVEGRTTAHRLQLRGRRARIKDRAARHALNFARLALLRRPGKGRPNE